MELNEVNLKKVSYYLSWTLLPDLYVREAAERYLDGFAAEGNYSIILLHLIDKPEETEEVRVAAAIALKNLIKKQWSPVEDSQLPIIANEEKNYLKSWLLGLMIRSPPAISKQMSDVIYLVAQQDFPGNWASLLDEMVAIIQSNDLQGIECVLSTIYELTKHYRFDLKSDSLWEEIIQVLDKMAEPLMGLLGAEINALRLNVNDEAALKATIDILVWIAKIFLSLNYQDLPEFFEDNLSEWMSSFNFILTFEQEMRALDDLRDRIYVNLHLYASRYFLEFQPYQEVFLTATFELLQLVGQIQNENLIADCLVFCSLLVERHENYLIFGSLESLQNIFTIAVLPNLEHSAEDVQMFEEQPEDYIKFELEGFARASKRQAAYDLLNTISRSYEEHVFRIICHYLDIFLNQYNEDPFNEWKAKEVLIQLVMAFATRSGCRKRTILQVSPCLDLQVFCEQHILPELSKPDINEHPLLTATCMLFLIDFNSFVGKQALLDCLIQLIRYIDAESSVVQCFAVCGIEKALQVKDPEDRDLLLLTPSDLASCRNDLISRLFGVLSDENDYAIKAIKQSCASLQEELQPLLELMLPKLLHNLTVIAANPFNPNYTHELFEVLAFVIKMKGATNIPEELRELEAELMPILLEILQRDVVEYKPYIFQLFALLMEARVDDEPLTDVYWNLYPHLLDPTLWTEIGYIKPLCRLISNFIKRMEPERVAEDNVKQIVMIVCSKVFACKRYSHEGFGVLRSLIMYSEWQELQQFMQEIFQILIVHWQSSRTTDFTRQFMLFIFFYVTQIDTYNLIDLIDSLGEGIFKNLIIDKVLLPHLPELTHEEDRKLAAMGLIEMLTEASALCQSLRVSRGATLIFMLLDLLETQDHLSWPEDSWSEESSSPEYEVSFVELQFAVEQRVDLFPHIDDIRRHFMEQLGHLAMRRQDDLVSLINQLQPELVEILRAYSQHYGIALY